MKDAPAKGEATPEVVDVVDVHDRVVATATRADMRRRRLRHRCVFILVRRTDATVLVHRRSEHKDLWPGRWDIAVGGVVVSGEGWEAAAARELAEEIGVTDARLRAVRAGHYQDADVSEVARVYEATWDGPVTFADGEVVAAVWLAPAELAAWVAAAPGAFCPDSIALARDLVA